MIDSYSQSTGSPGLPRIGVVKKFVVVCFGKVV